MSPPLVIANQVITWLITCYSKPVLAVSLVDIPAALNNFSSPEPIINLTLRLDTRGHIATSNAILISNITEPESGGVAGKLKGLFGGKKDKTENAADGEAGELEDEVEEVEKPAKKGKKEKVAIKFKEKIMGVKAMTGEEKRMTMAR